MLEEQADPELDSGAAPSRTAQPPEACDWPTGQALADRGWQLCRALVRPDIRQSGARARRCRATRNPPEWR